MRGAAELDLLETPVPSLLRQVTGGLKTDPHGSFATLRAAGVRSTQRLAIGDVGGGIVVLTWPAELVEQAEHVYTAERGHRLLEAAAEGGWDVDLRPHLAFWLARPEERLYTNPRPTMAAEEYVARWEGDDDERIGAHPRQTVRGELWPWLLERGYASAKDEDELEPFIGRLESRRRDAHLRPALRLLRRWEREDVAALGGHDQLAHVVREAMNRLLRAVDDPPLRVR